MTLGALLTLGVVALVGVTLMTMGGTLFVGQQNGRFGNAMLCLLGVMIVAMAVVAIVYRVD
jgi:hypothetical protein